MLFRKCQVERVRICDDISLKLLRGLDKSVEGLINSSGRFHVKSLRHHGESVLLGKSQEHITTGTLHLMDINISTKLTPFDCFITTYNKLMKVIMYKRRTSRKRNFHSSHGQEH